MDVKGKCCIVTGSGKGLGKEFAKRLLQGGACVTLSGRDVSAGETALAEFRDQFGAKKVVFVQCDVTKDDQLEELFEASERFFQRPVDILVNNAGINTNLGWRMCMQVNILALMSASQMALARMRGRSGCKIVNIASMAGLVAGLKEDMLAYFVSKHSVVNTTRSMAAYKASTNVDVVCLCPGWAETELVTKVHDKSRSDVDASVARMGLMSVQDVGDSFVKLMALKNGTVLSVTAKSPCIEYVDLSMARVVISTIIARLLKRMFGVELVRSWHLLVVLMLILLVLHLLFGYFLF